MNDYCVRIISPDANVLGLACVTTGLVNYACRLHGTHPTASAALGRALTGGALMGALLKNDQRVGLKIEGSGPLKKIIVEADNFGAVRGFVGVPEVDLPPKNGKIDVAGAVGHAGFLTVIKDLGLKKPYEGIVQLRTSEIAEDIAYYFAESEQIPSAVGLGVFVAPDTTISVAGGFLVQALPPSDDHVIDTLIAQIGSIPPVSECYRAGKTPEDLLVMIFKKNPFHVIEKRDLLYKCTCNRGKIELVIRSLGRDEIEAIRRDQGEAVIICEFCRNRYHFSGEELDHILATL